MFSKLPIVPVKQPEIAEKTTLLKNPQKFSALSYLKEDEDYQKSGYCSSVLLRTGIVRFAFFKLFGTGIVALISACRALNGKVAYSCALSAAVNAVASFHYYFIWSTRRQELPPSYKHMAFKLGGAAGPTEKDTIQRKILLQEYLVDGWRFSDWAVRAQIILSNSTHSSIPIHYTTSAACCDTDYIASYAVGTLASCRERKPHKKW